MSVGTHGAPRRRTNQRLLDMVLKALIPARVQFVDARFVHQQGLTPTVSGRVLKYPAIAFERASRRLSTSYQDLLFERYSALNSVHYGPGGRGYQSLAGGSPSEREARYQAQSSRLESFADRFSDLLRYSDGDQFLDLGCGTGQNIRFLAGRFPASPIVATDLNADALGLIRDFERRAGIELIVGDIHDQALLDRVLAQRPDHIVLSHVFSLIFGRSHAETRELRQRLVDRIADACRKSVVIIDSFGARGRMEIAIEQKHRAIVTDDVMSYFVHHASGRAVLAQSERTQAVLFFKEAREGPER